MNKNYCKSIACMLGFMALPCLAEAQTTSLTYSFTGAMQSFTVPACVTSLTLDVMGSKGDDCVYNSGSRPDDLGGLGGRVAAVYSVTPGQVLNIFVGGIPYNGGGTGAGSDLQPNGGGASDIRIGGMALTDRVIVAGGGGGGGNNCSFDAEPGGNGGGLTGDAGWECGSQTQSLVGEGGTQTAGGAAGMSPASPGSLGQGGDGGDQGSASGGGGGGYYGGGGADYGGGGGGSSYTNPSATSVVHTQGFNNGTGLVTISYSSSTITITSSSPDVCSGSTATLSVPNLQTYAWSNGAITATTQVSPTVATTYSIQGTDQAGCPVTGTISIGIVASTPTISASVTSASVCAGNSTTLTVSGNASTYSWNTGATTASVSVSPTLTTNYTVTGTNACGSVTAVTSVSVSNNPTLSLPASTVACGGGSVTLMATGTGVTSYSWNTGATTSSISVSPTVATNYTVSGTGACGTATAMTSVSIGAAPTVTAATSSATICITHSVVLTAAGSAGSTYLWNTGATTSSISVSPTSTTAYTVTASNVCGAIATSITQYVSLCTSLNELSGSEIRLYPNPASDLIHVSLPAYLLSGTASIEISDALGKIVISESLTKDASVVKLGQLEHGIYFFRILFNDELIQNGKIIKQ
jgi:hypothetical protein